jgi:hypothetical protein
MVQVGQRDPYTDYAEVEHRTPCRCFILLTGQKFRSKIETYFSERKTILAVNPQGISPGLIATQIERAEIVI